MDVQPRITEQGKAPAQGVPPLQNGDRLTRRAFPGLHLGGAAHGRPGRCAEGRAGWPRND